MREVITSIWTQTRSEFSVECCEDIKIAANAQRDSELLSAPSVQRSLKQPESVGDASTTQTSQWDVSAEQSCDSRMSSAEESGFWQTSG